ncbi:MAG: guanylate kinase [Alphaproteobacteria bacterium]
MAGERRGLLFVLSSPSGAGKTTITRRLLEADENLSMSVSVTTRPPRDGEIDGRDYHFIDRAAFDALVARDALLEHAQVFDHWYGTPREPVESALGTGKDMVFDIDWQGARQIGARMRDDMVSVFILPPSMTELHDRLRRRAKDSEKVVIARMAKAVDEVSHYDEYDYVIVNDDLERATAAVRSILAAERLRRSRQLWLAPFVARLLGPT